MSKSLIEYPSDRSVRFTRTFDAPREMVWRAYTDPQQVVLWWGPKGFTNTIHEMDVRPGGVWRLTMHGPDGADYPNRIEFIEVEQPARLVYHHGDDRIPRMFHVATTFTAEGKKTKIVSLMTFQSAAERDETMKHAGDGHQSTMNRLDDQLVAMKDGDREIVISRVLDAPRELVWEAMSDAKHVVNWWGPRGFTTTTEKMDFRPGGVWQHVMRGPDGTNYPNKSVFKEIVKPERIVYSHGGGREDGPGATFVATWTFEAVGARRTRLTVRMRFPDAAARELVVREFGAIEGGKQTLERLSEHLPKMMASAKDFVLTRTFDAPRELVWKAWTEVDALKQWFGPKGFTMQTCTLELKPGGSFHYGMKTPDGHEMWGRWIFKEIVPPEKMVVIVSFSDANRGITRHPGSAVWPLETKSEMTLTEEGGKTKVVLHWSPYNATPEERAMFDSSHGSMEQGWGGTMDQLSAYLARQ